MRAIHGAGTASSRCRETTAISSCDLSDAWCGRAVGTDEIQSSASAAIRSASLLCSSRSLALSWFSLALHVCPASLSITRRSPFAPSLAGIAPVATPIPAVPRTAGSLEERAAEAEMYDSEAPDLLSRVPLPDHGARSGVER